MLLDEQLVMIKRCNWRVSTVEQVPKKRPGIGIGVGRKTDELRKELLRSRILSHNE